MDVLADLSFLFALANERHADHPIATAWFDRQPAGFHLRICRIVQVAFFRLLTHPDAMDAEPLSATEAWALYAGLLADPNIGFCHEPPDLAQSWIPLAKNPAHPAQAMYLAAFAIRSDLSIVTLDPAFTTIPGLQAEVLGS